MLANDVIQKIEKLATEVATREGCRLYHVEFAGGGGGRILRVLIDKDLEGGAGLEDCANVSRGLNLLLDVEDPIPGGQYNLEVSTPGVERPLQKAWHFQAVIGKKIWAKLNANLKTIGVQAQKYAGHKQVSEILKAATEQAIQVELEGETVTIPLDRIERAHLVFDFSATKGQKRKL